MTDTHDNEVMIIKKPLALVLGATGGIGGAVAQKLLDQGYDVRALHRKAHEQALKAPHYEWVAGDAMNREDVMRAASGAALIVHAVNPPGYRNWGTLVLPMIYNTIAAAKAVQARILMPGTIYNYGPETFDCVVEDSPQHPVSAKGRIRVVLEQRLEAAARAGTQVILVRAGDFFGPGAGNNWFAQAVVKPGAALKAITNPGAPGIGHQWAFLPDVAETMVRLVARADELPAFARFHMEGFRDHDGQQLAEAIRRVTGKAGLPVRPFPWWMLRLASPFVPVFRELLEMRYLWKTELYLSNDRLKAFLGEEPRTPIAEAVRETLKGLGCLDVGPEAALETSGIASGMRVSA
ncbi:MAG: NAD(P)H-binding protein [Hoeflea sp.]|uniref:NAD-dependent epimerase/dehydratase family protein n=1 Tax=Hoeflea sp. TaxID=1940281 RepID=UPI001D5C1CDB|nr:NAD-dependent epimerase/dehydratase family protein [Hoeflea sp.]MBU4527192.1 NAD(P)H-binding protein [Alphaproteobacteria bacterium]MBU4547025.1 NAD(P)H-binding protein [Alphaproteobacteria bacterium]MBU4551463.1 NAD(P)H-binding protein [Alphaproteobacteria bacterium]MBV1725468.1 NAD(P)H-binding protein [Hoeflea sp.]MBV1759516.1 NAD(P)H-binding protein [Hoeflea sp.]